MLGLIQRAVTVVVLASLLPVCNMDEPQVALPPPAPRVRMIASFYGPGFAGRPTASGRIFQPEAFTAAHRTLPFGTRLRLTNPKTNASVVVEITDRGPYAVFDGVTYYSGNRDLDVSIGVARTLGFLREGVASLEAQLASAAYPPPLRPTPR
jgi:rare lipoprotein A